MRFFLLALMLGGALGCTNRLDRLCQEAVGNPPGLSTNVHHECNSKVGTFTSQHETHYETVINKALALSMKYMTMVSHFGRDTNSRMGFKKLFREASDERFKEAVSMIKYVTKRGGSVSAINVQPEDTAQKLPSLQPLTSLGWALTDAKDMYKEKARLHRDALCISSSPSAGYATEDHRGCAIDADLAHQMQDAIDTEVGRINDLASKANLLAAMYTNGEHKLAEHLFDEHLM